MATPSFKDFKELAREGNLIPVFEEVLADLETPVSAFKKINGQSHGFLLESIEGGEKWGRYSFLGTGPSMIFRSKGRFVEIIKNGKVIFSGEVEDPIEKLKKIMSLYRPVDVPQLPRFFGGAVGYMGYDMVHFIERLPNSNDDDLEAYDAYFIITDNIIVFDNVHNTIKVVANICIDDYPDLEEAYLAATNQINRTVNRLNQPLKLSDLNFDDDVPLFVDSNFSKKDWINAIDRCRDYICKGDIIQAVLSQRFQVEAQVEPFNLYRALRTINPSPYMFYLQFEGMTLVGSSPEILVRLEGDHVELRPIAGTRPRGSDPIEDEKLKTDLLADPKELAEHIMLVDLGRNDLGRISEYGSVKVNDLMRVENYSHVMHIVSDVDGQLRNGCDCFDVLRATFPAGTLSGAPKIRAMEIIDELEPTRRGPYGGSVGYFSYSGNMDMCITIRTLMLWRGKIYLQAGAGIVYDSDPEKEYQETQHKAKGMLKAIEMARKHPALRVF
jgi:anthranilate synthase component 1